MLFDENKQFQSILGDFTVFWIRKEPMILVNKGWQDIAKEILINFYKIADMPSPEWIERFVEQRDSIDESMEKTHFELRGFFVNKINDAYNKNIRIDNRVCTYSDVDIRQKFKYSLKNKLLSFISEIKESSMMVSVDIMKELRMLAGIENITGLKDIGVQSDLTIRIYVLMENA